MAKREEIIVALKEFNWKISNDPSNPRLINPKGGRTNLYLWSDSLRLEFDNDGMWGENGKGSLHFGYKGINIEKLSETTVCLKANEHVFINLYSH